MHVIEHTTPESRAEFCRQWRIATGRQRGARAVVLALHRYLGAR